ncbi:peptidase M16 [Bacteroidia bacterium]|nr:peptidase M16 [Bacteroidia bacterium]
MDPKVRYGKLDNGVTYYIRHNELPKQRADFYIAQNVGSILEEDEQNGLAHFLEHMAFNGSLHFPGNSLISYLESIGVKFGANLNAYTSFDQTVYNISDVPVIREGIIDSCLLILHDWSGFLLLEDKEIDKERGVIREEMRSRENAGQRMSEKLMPVILPGNQYAKRNLIGTEDIILNFRPETLRDFYKKWYRPDLQGLVIVGDIDPEQIEQKLRALYTDDPARENPAERIYYQVDDNDEPLVAIVTDKETTGTGVSLYFKHDPLPKALKGTIEAMKTNYMNMVIATIFRERFSEIMQKPNPPFLGANAGNSRFINTATKESFSAAVSVKDNDTEGGLKALVRELVRAQKHGFTNAEYERVKTNMLTMYETAYKERDKMKNGNYAKEYVNHFVNGGSIPGIEKTYELAQTIISKISIEMINQHLQGLIGDKNRVITLTAPEKEDLTLPAKDDLLKWISEVEAEEIEGMKEEAANKPLLTETPVGGKIVKTSQDKFGATVYTLSNGVKVVIKPTQFQEDEIMMSANSPGGSSLFPRTDTVNVKLYGTFSDIGGLGELNRIDLRKTLTGKKINLGSNISSHYEGLSGSSGIADFETLLQLVYLNFTAPRTDEEAYQSTVVRLKSQLEQAESQKNKSAEALTDTLTNILYKDVSYRKRIKSSDLAKADYQTIMNWRKDRYADASDFTFIFTGNIAPEQSKELIAKYLGALPSIKRKEKFIVRNENLQPGITRKSFPYKMENAKSSIVNVYWTKIKPNLKNRLELDMLKQILQIVYTEKIRENEGGTYGVNVAAGISNYPKGQTSVQISFETQPGKETHLNEIVQTEFQNLAKNGPRKEDFDKVKAFILKQHQEQTQSNSYWNSLLTGYYTDKSNTHNSFIKTVNAIRPSGIQKKAQTVIGAKNWVEVIMTGEKEKEQQ